MFYGSLAGPSAAPDWQYSPGSSGNELGAAVSAGDVDGDGFADVLAGAPGDRAYAALLFRGSAGGPSTTPDWQATGGIGSALTSHRTQTSTGTASTTRW